MYGIEIAGRKKREIEIEIESNFNNEIEIDIRGSGIFDIEIEIEISIISMILRLPENHEIMPTLITRGSVERSVLAAGSSILEWKKRKSRKGKMKKSCAEYEGRDERRHSSRREASRNFGTPKSVRS